MLRKRSPRHLLRRHLFIDCGGNNGQSVRKFRSEFDPDARFTIHTFEPNPRFASCYSGMQRHVLHRQAVWTADGEMDFYLDNGSGAGSSLMRSKLTGDLDFDSPLRVQTIDFSQWLLKHCRKRDYIVLKLDIEGAEFDVLEKMIADGSLQYVDRLFIDWHWQKVQVPKQRMDDIVGQITMPVKRWNALRY